MLLKIILRYREKDGKVRKVFYRVLNQVTTNVLQNYYWMDRGIQLIGYVFLLNVLGLKLVILISNYVVGLSFPSM